MIEDTPKPSRCFGVVEPGSAQADFFREAFRSDAVELLSDRGWKIGNSVFYRVLTRALGTAGLIRACRAVAIRDRLSFDQVYSEAIQRTLLFIDSTNVFLCADPNEGRRYWLSQAWKGGEC